MPNELCNTKYWSIQSTTSGLSIEQALFEDDECKFIVDFERGSDGQDVNYLNLNYDLVYHKTVASTPIKISTSARIPALNEPLIITTDTNTSLKDNFRFSFPMRISSPNLKFNPDNIEPVSGKIKCGNQESDVLLSINKDANGFLFITGSAPEFGTRVEKCNINGIFKVTGRGNSAAKSFILTSNSSLHIAYN